MSPSGHEFISILLARAALCCMGNVSQRVSGLIGVIVLTSSGWGRVCNSSLSAWLGLAKELGSRLSIGIKAWIYARA